LSKNEQIEHHIRKETHKLVTLRFTLSKNNKVENHIRKKTHKFIALRF